MSLTLRDIQLSFASRVGYYFGGNKSFNHRVPTRTGKMGRHFPVREF